MSAFCNELNSFPETYSDPFSVGEREKDPAKGGLVARTAEIILRHRELDFSSGTRRIHIRIRVRTYAACLLIIDSIRSNMKVDHELYRRAVQ
jgi:hypothetical protein